jgi:hypothetical protein
MTNNISFNSAPEVNLTSFNLPTSQRENPTSHLPSYFSYIYYELYIQNNITPDQITMEERSHPTLRTYEHPRWINWDNIWNTSPIVFNPDNITIEIENTFHSALYRVTTSSESIVDLPNFVTFRQGTTITFKGFESPYDRHIVEWCQWMDDHTAYLKVIGIRPSGVPIPWNDNDYPSFILEVPACIANVPIPLPIRPFITFDQEFRDEEELEMVSCWACNWD